MELTQEYLKTVLHYDPDTGIFRWARRRQGVAFGAIAGHVDIKGYRLIGFDGKRYKAHRLAVIYTGGTIEKGEQIDHLNGMRDDNRIFNLRICTNSQNSQNRRRVRSGTKFKGVSINKSSFGAAITANGARYHLGHFQSAEEAAKAYDAAAVQLFGEFACTNIDLGLL